MNTLVFSILWTVACSVLVVAFFWQEGFGSNPTWFNILAMLMPSAGVPFIWDGLRKLRRRGSVRRRADTYVWTDLDGSERRSPTDPRIAWDEDDRNFSDN